VAVTFIHLDLEIKQFLFKAIDEIHVGKFLSDFIDSRLRVVGLPYY
jgi:hypothetical protein